MLTIWYAWHQTRVVLWAIWLKKNGCIVCKSGHNCDKRLQERKKLDELKESSVVKEWNNNTYGTREIEAGETEQEE